MSRVLIAGLCPLPFEDALRNEGPGLRSWQFALGLARAGHHVQLVAWRVPGAYGQAVPPTTETREGVSIERVDEASFFNPDDMRRTIERLDPDALVGATIHGSYALARCRTDLPFWADQFGHTMAEAQAKAALDGNNSVLAYYWRRVETVMRRADRISVVSTRQRYAAIGELGALGRLSRETCGYDLVSVVPCAAMPFSADLRDPLVRGVVVPADAFIVLWTGGFNTWSDVETLMRGLEEAMQRRPRIHFVATGAEIPNQDPVTYRRFEALVAASALRDRFRLAGWVRKADVARYVAEADIGVLTERPIHEGELGSKNRLLQWMAAGLPVAYNRVGELGDLVSARELGLTFAAGDPQGLADRILWASENGSNLREMAAATQEIVAREFSVEATTRSLATWAKEPSRAPDGSSRSQVQTPYDHGSASALVARRAEAWLPGPASRWLRQLLQSRGASERAPAALASPPALLPLLLAVLAVAPSLGWIARDRSVWPWDQANYAWNSLHLYEAIGQPRVWLRLMEDCLGAWPPAIAWIGQFFVPLGEFIGSVEAGLLLFVLLTQAATVWVVSRTLLALSGGKRLVATAGGLMIAGAPLFVFLTTQYLTEPLQTLSAAWFIWIAARSRRWSRAATIGQLVLAASFGMLTKATTPLFCLLPGLVAVGNVIRPQGLTPRVRWHPAFLVASLGTAGLALLASLVWYARNLRLVLLHVAKASTGPVAELYGRQESFPATLAFWLSTMGSRLFTPPTLGIVLAIACAALLAVLSSHRRTDGHFNLCAGASLAQVMLGLAFFCSSPNRDPRYLLGFLPHLALVVGWALTSLGSRWVTAAAAALFALQIAWVQADVLGLGDRPFRTGYPRPVDETERAAVVSAIVKGTCTESSHGRRHLIGVDLPWINGHAATFASAKLRLGGSLPWRCDYYSFAYGTPEWAQEILEGLNIQYYVRLDPKVYPIPTGLEFVNKTAPVVFERMRSSGELVAAAWQGPPGVQVFRRQTRPR